MLLLLKEKQDAQMLMILAFSILFFKWRVEDPVLSLLLIVVMQCGCPLSNWPATSGLISPLLIVEILKDRTLRGTLLNRESLDDVIEAQHFDREILSAIFEVAREMETIEKKSCGNQILKVFLVATLFYEPSTRIRLSFESAMKRLGGEVLTTENAREFSSAAKGDT
ncbi:putative aspartate carbamoyltransferase [Helianthus anomalus]